MNLKKKLPNIRHVNISSDTSNSITRANSEKRIISENMPFDIIEAYKAARTNIMFSLNSEKGCRKVVISSATSGEGKSTTCINLAKTFAEIGVKVLILDADLRAPRVHKYMCIENEKGLSNILAGFDKLDDCIYHTEQENLDCLTSGAIPPNPVELISSDAMTELFEELEKRYDYVFIDTPPLNIVTEGLLLSKICNGIIIVTRQKYTMYKMIERAINSLKFANAKILGFILNDADDDSYIYGVYKSRNKKRNRYMRYGYYSYGYSSSYAKSSSSSNSESSSKSDKSDKHGKHSSKGKKKKPGFFKKLFKSKKDKK